MGAAAQVPAWALCFEGPPAVLATDPSFFSGGRTGKTFQFPGQTCRSGSVQTPVGGFWWSGVLGLGFILIVIIVFRSRNPELSGGGLSGEVRGE